MLITSDGLLHSLHDDACSESEDMIARDFTVVEWGAGYATIAAEYCHECGASESEMLDIETPSDEEIARINGLGR